MLFFVGEDNRIKKKSQTLTTLGLYDISEVTLGQKKIIKLRKAASLSTLIQGISGREESRAHASQQLVMCS